MAEITLEKVDQVIERTGCTYSEAKEALLHSDGDVLDAVIYLTDSNSEGSVDEVVTRLKETISKGTVEKVRIVRNGETLLTVPVVVGAAGALLGLMAAPFALIAGTLAAYHMDCRIELVKEDGSVEEFK